MQIKNNHHVLLDYGKVDFFKNELNTYILILAVHGRGFLKSQDVK